MAESINCMYIYIAAAAGPGPAAGPGRRRLDHRQHPCGWEELVVVSSGGPFVRRGFDATTDFTRPAGAGRDHKTHNATRTTQ